MAFNYTSSGGLFVKLGHGYASALDIFVSQGSALTAPDISVTQYTRANTLIADYGNGTVQQNIATGLFTQLSSYQSNNQYASYLISTLGPATLVDMLNTYKPLAAKTNLAALQSLIADMVATNTTVQQSSPAVGAQTAATPAPVGNPILVVSVKDGFGVNLQYVFAETLKFVVTADAQTGGATQFQETISIYGAAAASSGLAYNWPQGSGTNGVTIQCIDAAQNMSGGNLTQNGSFETWSNGTSGVTPDNWIAVTNEAGMSQSSTNYRGSFSLQFTGSTGVNTSVVQPFNTAASTTHGGGGSSAKLLPDVPYPFCIFYKLSAGSPGAGVLAANLVDGTNTIINDDQSTPNTISVALTGIGDTNWHALFGYFRLPKVLPATYKIRLWLSTGLSTGTNLNLDLAGIGGVTNSSGAKILYQGGEAVAAFSGSTAPLKNDTWTVAVTNTMGVFQGLFQRVYNMTGLGLSLPANSSPTISDTLVA